MSYETSAGKRAARMATDPGMEGRDADDRDFVGRGHNIEQMLNELSDQLNETSERVGGLFHRFDPVLVRPMPSPTAGDMEKSPESMQSSIYDMIQEKRSQVYRINRQLEELLDRCNL